MSRPRLKMRLGDLQVHECIITEQQLADALAKQKETGRKLGATLIELGYLTEDQLLQFLSQQLNLPYIDISQRRIAPEVVKLLPEVYARRYRALVIDKQGDVVTVAMSDPADLAALDQLTVLLSPHQLKLVVAKEQQLLEAFDHLYRRTEEIETFASQLEQEYEQVDEFELTALSEGSEDDATVAKMLQSIFEDAVQMRASDIHIEPDEKVLRIRQRVDGQLHESLLPEVNIAGALVLRLKLMSGLDIAEKRLPQDGRFNIRIRNRSIDVRLSTMPVQYGESVVMRLLDQSAGLLTLDQTGMPDRLLTRMRYLLGRPHGMILVTGPTGSGKTTTLYGALSELNVPEKKIITVEDPVEYRLPRINQVQVHDKIGLTFSRVLRTTLRQDPDIIMVGEMRDKETVEIGLRGALTGHLVLSTLHTNDAISTAVRLIDMGAAPYLVASALRAVIAQRLVRRICANCVADDQPDASDLTWLQGISRTDLTGVRFKKGRGCNVCNQTGYRGRIGVFELLEMTEALIRALKQGDADAFEQAARQDSNFVPLAEAALEYALSGITSVEEVLRLADNVSALGRDQGAD